MVQILFGGDLKMVCTQQRRRPQSADAIDNSHRIPGAKSQHTPQVMRFIRQEWKLPVPVSQPIQTSRINQQATKFSHRQEKHCPDGLPPASLR